MNKTFEMLKNHKVVAIIRGLSSEYVVDTVRALKDGGIYCVEVAFNQKDPNSISDTLKAISLIRNTFGDEVSVGAGTVISEENVKGAFQAGAQFMISPNINYKVIEETKKLGAVSIPGALTSSEAVSAYKAGGDIIKLFPAGVLGVDYLKALAAPLSYIPFTAVGGINAENAADFIKAGACGVGVGGNLVQVKLIKEGRFSEITELAREYKI